METEPNTIHIGLIALIFAGLAMDGKAYWFAGVLTLIGALFIWANLTSS